MKWYWPLPETPGILFSDVLVMVMKELNQHRCGLMWKSRQNTKFSLCGFSVADPSKYFGIPQ